MGDQVVVGRADADAALVLPSTAGVVWAALATWSSVDQLGATLAERYPDVPPAERAEALAAILELLDEAGLVERAP